MGRYIVFLFIIILTSGSLFAQEYARIKNSVTKYIIKSLEDIEVERSYTIVIKDEKGDKYSQFYDYYDQFKKITKLSMIIRDMNGKKIRKLGKADAYDVMFNQSFEIGDARMLIINPDYKNYPYEVEVNEVIKFNGIIGFPEWLPRAYFNVGVDYAKLMVTVHPDIEIRWHQEYINKDLELSTIDGNRVFIWEISDLEAVKQDIHYKEFYETQPKVLLAPTNFQLDGFSGRMDTWQDFGKWFFELNNNDYRLSDETKSFLDGRIGENPDEIINDVYRYMQDRTRYVSIQLGIGGFKSIATEEVEQTGYGDCKALSTYMKNMLDYVGIPSNYILVRAGRDVPDVKDDFPSNQFNHVFIGVPLERDTILLECTSQMVPPDYIGTFTDDRNVLWISEDESKIVRSRSYDMDKNLKRTFAKVEIDEQGNAEMSLNVEKSGVLFDEILMLKSAGKDYIESFNYKRFPFKDFTITDFQFDQEDREEPKFISSFELKVNGLGKVLGDKIILPVNLLKPARDYINYDEYKNFAEVRRGFTIVDEVDIFFAHSFWVSNLPDKIKIESEYGSLDINILHEGNKIHIVRTLKIQNGTYKQDDFRKFSNFVKEISRAEKTKLVLNLKT